MSLMASLYKMGTGLNTAQNGLYVTSHNISNAETPGYSRQRILQSDNSYLDSGFGMKVGMGVQIDTLQQLRDSFLDRTFREETSKGGYHVAIQESVGELENIMGEINGESLSGQMDDLWSSINALSGHPEGIETRKAFLDNASKFMDRANHLHDEMAKYQHDLDGQVKRAVDEINNLSSQIAQYNQKIAEEEMGGDHANDYRDQRNLLLDELSNYGEISVTEDRTGQVSVMFEGASLVNKNSANTLGLRYLNDANGESFVEPVWAQPGEILPFDNTSARPLYSKERLQSTNPSSGNDNGFLRGLLVSRGTKSADATTTKADSEGFVIPTVQKELDTLINKITGMINNIVNPATGDKPYDAYGNQNNNADGTGNELVFVLKDPSKGYTFGNIEVNPVLLDSPSKIALSASGKPADNTLIEKMLSEWKNSDGDFSPQADSLGKKQNFEDFYAEVVARLGGIGQQSMSMVNTQNTMLNDLDNKRLAVCGVSMDEEMGNMIIYQHAYNASAKVYNVIDGMLDTIINRM